MTRPSARIYQWASTDATALARQDATRAEAQALGYSVAATYSEQGAAAGNAYPQLQRLMADLNEHDTIIVERLDRITLLPIDKVIALMGTISAKDAAVSIPGLLDLAHTAKATAVIVRETMQAMLLKVVLYQCRSNWEERHERRTQAYGLPAKDRPVHHTVQAPSA